MVKLLISSNNSTLSKYCRYFPHYQNLFLFLSSLKKLTAKKSLHFPLLFY